MKTRITPKQIIDLIEKLPDADQHIYSKNGRYYVSQEWLCGVIAGRAFEGGSVEEAAEQLIDYLYDHIGHDSIVGNVVARSGFPDLDSVERYCKPVVEDENL